MKKVRTVTLPEPKPVKQIHSIRRKIQNRAEKIGWENYLKEINSRPSLLAEPQSMVLKESPKKQYGSR